MYRNDFVFELELMVLVLVLFKCLNILEGIIDFVLNDCISCCKRVESFLFVFVNGNYLVVNGFLVVL